MILASQLNPETLAFFALIGAIIGCGITGFIATQRHRNFFGWAAIAFLISPLIAIIILLCIEPGRSQERAYAGGGRGGHRGRAGSSRSGAARAGARRAGAGRAGPDRAGSGRAGSGRAGTGRAGTGRARGGRAGAGRSPQSRRRVPTPQQTTPPPIPPGEPAAPPPVPTSIPSAPIDDFGSGTYWVPTSTGKQGPFTAEQLSKFVAAGKIPETLSVIDEATELKIAVRDLI